MTTRLVSIRPDRSTRARRWRRIALALVSLPVIALTAGTALAKARAYGRDAATARRHGRDGALAHLQTLVDQIRQRLGIERAVSVAIVDKNPFLVSVEAPAQPDGAFEVRVEAHMLDLLTADELEAVLAHELGHVWIFTHHPYLQTELLANQVAMRTVSRDALARVYEKVWKQGPKGDLVSFLGRADEP